MAYSVRYGGKKGTKQTFSISNNLVAIRTEGVRAIDSVISRRESAKSMSAMERVLEFAEANVSVFRINQTAKAKAL